VVPEEPSANPNGPEPAEPESSADETSQMPAVSPAPARDSVIWPEDPWVADTRAAADPNLERGPIVTSPVIPTWQESHTGGPSVPSHAGRNPTEDDPVTAPFPTARPQQPSPIMDTTPPQPASEPEEEVHDTVPPEPVAASEGPAAPETPEAPVGEEVETRDAELETLPAEVASVESQEEESPGPAAEEAVIAAVAEEQEPPAPSEAESPAEPEPVAAAAEPVSEPEPEPQPEPASEPVMAAEPEPPTEPERAAEQAPVEPLTPAPATPAWAAQATPPEATPATPAPAAPFKPVNPAIPSWAPSAPAAAAAPAEAPVQWPGINVPNWAPQPTASHPGTASPLPAAGGPYADPSVRPSAPMRAAPAPAPAPQPAPAPASAPAPSPSVAPTPPSVPTAAPAAQAKPSTASWEVVEQRRQAEPVRQGPTAEDKSYAEWFAWAKRSGAPASACHAAAQGAFRALAAGHDMNTAVQWATLAMASPPGLVGQSRQIYCAWFSLANIDLKLPTPQAHAFAIGAISALEQGADSMAAHQAGLAAAGITGG
jgi:hypothetical protein